VHKNAYRCSFGEDFHFPVPSGSTADDLFIRVCLRPSILITPVYCRQVLASHPAIVVTSVYCMVVIITGPAASPRTFSSGCVCALLFTPFYCHHVLVHCITPFYCRHVLVSRPSTVAASVYHSLLLLSRPCMIVVVSLYDGGRRRSGSTTGNLFIRVCLRPSIVITYVCHALLLSSRPCITPFYCRQVWGVGFRGSVSGLSQP